MSNVIEKCKCMCYLFMSCSMNYCGKILLLAGLLTLFLQMTFSMFLLSSSTLKILVIVNFKMKFYI